MRLHIFTLFYGDYEALIEIETLSIYRGWLPPRALGLVMEWAASHPQELRQDWQRAQAGEVLVPIEPLD
jgi:hypothetical protein